MYDNHRSSALPLVSRASKIWKIGCHWSRKCTHRQTCHTLLSLQTKQTWLICAQYVQHTILSLLTCTRCTGELKWYDVIATPYWCWHGNVPDAWLCSFFVSAKTGDNVATAFYRIVADLADVTLTSPDISNAAKVITAQVINHPQDELNSSTNNKRIRSQTRCCTM